MAKTCWRCAPQFVRGRRAGRPEDPQPVLALVADLVSDRYFGQIQRWCKSAKVASSGHTLSEESLLHHGPQDGNKLKCLARMDIPGEDMLTSNPDVAIDSGWMTVAMPASAAVLTGAAACLPRSVTLRREWAGWGRPRWRTCKRRRPGRRRGALPTSRSITMSPPGRKRTTRRTASMWDG